MPLSGYLRDLRALVGHRPLVLPSVSVAIKDGDRFLLGRHEDHEKWVFPGGGVDPDEQPSDAAVREAWEETGLHVRLTRLIGCYGGAKHHIEYPNGDVVDYVTAAFEAEPVAGQLDLDSEELVEFGWYTLDEIDRLDTAPWVDEVVDALRDPSRTFVPPIWRPPE